MQFGEEEKKDEAYNAPFRTQGSNEDSEDSNDLRSSRSSVVPSSPYVNHDMVRKPTKLADYRPEKFNIIKKHAVELTDE